MTTQFRNNTFPNRKETVIHNKMNILPHTFLKFHSLTILTTKINRKIPKRKTSPKGTISKRNEKKNAYFFNEEKRRRSKNPTIAVVSCLVNCCKESDIRNKNVVRSEIKTADKLFLPFLPLLKFEFYFETFFLRE